MFRPAFAASAACLLCGPASASDDPIPVPAGQGVELDPTAAITVPVQDTDMRIYYKDSLRFETADRMFTARIGGRIHFDWTFVSGDEGLSDAQTEDNIQFRRARIHMQGTMRERFGYRLAYDFGVPDVAQQDPSLAARERGGALQDAYIEMRDVIGGIDLLIGQFKEPFGLEWLASSNDITFLERSVSSVLNPTRGSGLMFAGDALEGDFAWGLAFVGSDGGLSGDNFGDGAYALTGRAAWGSDEVLGDAEDETLLHLGVSFSNRGSDGDLIARPEFGSDANYISTGGVLDGVTEGSTSLGFEAAAVLGAFSLQGEYVFRDFDADTGDPATSDPTLSGYYVQASYFLSGETRPYQRGRFGRPGPRSNWNGFGDGIGAWELAARYSVLDLDEAAADNQLEDVTLGVNWYLNPGMRVMANVVLAESDLPDSDAEALGLRFQYVF